ncbi:negative regulator of AmpC, AmpD [gamma proteobacterium HTCC5015]|nr:negative regulator of AmpC, AmpD [gamma proteobacterium HTCC5015]
MTDVQTQRQQTWSIDVDSGWLSGEGVRHVPSPNFDERQVASPHCDEREAIDLLVVHNISLPPNQFGGEGIEQLFTNCLDPSEHPYYEGIYQLKVSAHALVRRDGEVVQFVPFHKRAWHAGQSSYCGRDKCNDFAIGIELEGSDDQPFEAEQYRALVALTAQLIQTYPQLSAEHIVGHSDIAPGRKTDPGPHFKWADYRKQLKQTLV